MCCPKNETSRGARTFFETSYRELKMLNPNLPIKIRWGVGTEARLLALYGRGVERQLSVEGMSSSEVEAKVRDLSEGPIAADALQHEEWRALLDTDRSFGLYLQLHGGAQWEKSQHQDFMGIFEDENNRSGITDEQKATVATYKALSPEKKAEYDSSSFKGYCKERERATAAGSRSGMLMTQWAALPAPEKERHAADWVESEGMRYFAVAAEEELSARRRVAGEPDEAEDLFLRGMWEALPEAERADYSSRALSGAEMKSYRVVPPFWEQ